jgi:copper chaperone CopZ
MIQPMTHSYNITGMSCGSCVARIKSALLKIGDVTEANVQLTAPQATISMQRHIPLEKLQAAIGSTGNFVIAEANSSFTEINASESTSWLATYKPILLVSAYIIIITVLPAITNGNFDWETWMRHFMAAFFLVFSFFKFLNLKAFADAYSSYDIVAKQWNGWGYVYAFIELALGFAFLLHFNPLITNGVAFVVMSISIIGVLQSVLNKRKIQRACLGTVFNLPMSTITIIEDGLMIAMSAIMITTMIF